MAHRGRHRADEALLMALLHGSTIEAAAQKAGISRRTASRRCQEPAFQQRLQREKEELMERTRRVILAAGLSSVKTMVQLQEANHPGSVRFAAAKFLLDSGHRNWQSESLAARVGQVEQQLATELADAAQPRATPQSGMSPPPLDKVASDDIVHNQEEVNRPEPKK
jgi:hypothetical protein